jgi:putative hydrolase of the HAD superfamily
MIFEPAPARLGLLVDWGGVLTTSVFESFDRFAEREGLEPGSVAFLFRTEPRARELLAGLETGQLAEAEFERGLGELLDVSPDGLIGRMMQSAALSPSMVAAVATARRRGVATGLVSNSWGAGGYPAEVLRDLFDAVVISGRVGVRKPSDKIYRLGAESVGLRPDQCVFVDDLAVNLGPARELGMAVVHHTDPARTIAELEELLGVSLDDQDQGQGQDQDQDVDVVADAADSAPAAARPQTPVRTS